MYNPCLGCMRRYGHAYTRACDEKCEYANAISKLRPYGSIDEIVEVMNGDRFPLVFIDEEHIDSTYRIVCAAKEGMI